MPQMAPLNWLSLFSMLIAMYMIFNSLNYFAFTYKPKKSKLSSKALHKNWKW